jgi:hypothetical protein
MTLNHWFACKPCELILGRKGHKTKDHENKYAEYENKYAEYENKYAEYEKKYAEYDKKHAEYEKKYGIYVIINMQKSPSRGIHSKYAAYVH